MKRKKPIFISLTFTLLTSVFAFNILSNKDVIKVNANPASGASYYATNENNRYYEGISDTLVGEELMVALSTLTSTNFVSHSYKSLPSIYQYSDVALDDNTQMQMIYTGSAKPFNSGGLPSSVNKEHVWPASWYGNGTRTESAGSPGADAHNVWPCATELNSKRGSGAFDELDFASSYKAYEFTRTDWSYGTPGDDDSYVWSSAFNYTNGGPDSVLYPARGHRGAVARILMYVATRYRNDTRYPVKLHDKPVTEKSGRIGKLSTLLKWHFIEPPSAFEIKRNNEVATRWHHNRNPFVDNPDYARRIFYYLPEPDSNVVSPLVKSVIEQYAPTSEEGIKLSHTSLSVNVGKTKTVTVTANLRNEPITWLSNDESIATVNNGVIKGISAGTTTIVAQGSETSASLTVTVHEEGSSDILVESLNITPASLSLKVGQESTLSVSVTPSNATNQSLTWQTSNASVATVNNGKVSAVKAGNAVISAFSTDGSNKSASMSVTVTNPSTEDGYHLVTNISELNSGDKVILASRDKEVVAGNLSNTYYTSLEATFNVHKDVITSVDPVTTILTIGQNGSYYTFSNENGELLGSGAVKSIGYNKGVTDWTLTFSNNGDVTIQNKTTTNGRILYNDSAPRFTTYTSALSGTMLLPQLYKLVVNEESVSDKAHNYATLFLDTTADECSAGNVTLTTWNTLKSEYNTLNSEVKDYLYDHSETDVLIIELVARYRVIINKYHYENFLLNSNGDEIYNSTNVKAAAPTNGINNAPVFIMFFMFSVMTFIIVAHMYTAKEE